MATSIAIVAIGVVVVLSVEPGSSAPTRHTVSRIHLFARQWVDDNPIWIDATYKREIWLRPDGSGRIEEAYEPLAFPTKVDHDRWVEAGSQAPSALNETFEAGGLSYAIPRDIRRAILEVTDTTFTGPALRHAASVLVETVSSAEIIDEAVLVLGSLPGCKVARMGSMTVLSAIDATESPVEVSLTFDSQRGFLKEQWVAQEDVVGLDVKPPFVMFEREFLNSEILPNWSPP